MKNADEFTEPQRKLRSATTNDFSFDRLYPAPIRAKSARFWTPVAVASRAAQLFASQNVRRVLDVGSGVGKFCLVAACACPDIDFIGIEQRPHLVDAAHLVKARLDARNARFLVGDIAEAPWLEFDGLYLYNPFEENVSRDGTQLDHTVELSEQRLVVDLGHVLAALVVAAVGTCMVTYNGFGGLIPTTYDLVHAERAGIDWLRLWVKHRQTTKDGTYYRENEDGVTLVGLASASGPLDGERRPCP
jgi:SAM-dependent methyltransferase